jgi:hypothetical protein
LGYILGNFLTNSSGHPGVEQTAVSIEDVMGEPRIKITIYLEVIDIAHGFIG